MNKLILSLLLIVATSLMLFGIYSGDPLPANQRAEINENLAQVKVELHRLASEARDSNLPLDRYYDFLYKLGIEYDGRRAWEPVESSRWLLDQVQGKTLVDVIGR